MTRRISSPHDGGGELRAGANADLCTRCAAREAGSSGFCETCLQEHCAEEYASRDASEIAERRASWRARAIHYEGSPSDAALNARERQRRHRLLEAVRPREGAPPGTDPYELAREALFHLSRLRTVVRSHERLLPDLAAAEELVRELAWGPAEVPSPQGFAQRGSPSLSGAFPGARMTRT